MAQPRLEYFMILAAKGLAAKIIKNNPVKFRQPHAGPHFFRE